VIDEQVMPTAFAALMLMMLTQMDALVESGEDRCKSGRFTGETCQRRDQVRATVPTTGMAHRVEVRPRMAPIASIESILIRMR
jgi:hypothetical protein